MIEKAFDTMPEVQVKLFEPKGSPDARKMPVGTSKPRMTVARALFVKLMQHPHAMDNLERVADLVDGFETCTQIGVRPR